MCPRGENNIYVLAQPIYRDVKRLPRTKIRVQTTTAYSIELPALRECVFGATRVFL